MRPSFISALLLASFIGFLPMGSAVAEQLMDNRIKLLPYDEGDVYTLLTKYGYQTNVVFDKHETIETISVGDRSVWQIIPANNRLFIRPMVSGASTNMTVLTNKHAYQFDLKSTGTEEKDAENIYVAKFIYDRDQMPTSAMPARITTAAEPQAASAPVAESTATPPATPSPAEIKAIVPKPTAAEGPGVTQPIYPNYNYTYSGPDVLAPLQVFDNGKATFIKYRKLPDPLPEVMITDANGREESATPDIKESMLVISAIVSTLTLKQPQGSVTVYNELLNPSKQ